MRESGKRQGIDKWSNGWSCSTDFQRRNSKCEIKYKDVNIDNNSNHFTFSILFVIYKREEVEIMHEPSWYNKEQLPSLTSTHLILFDEVHIQQVSGPHTTSKFNKHKVLQSTLVNLTFKKILTLLWLMLDENKLVIWCLFYDIRNTTHSTKCSADGINFSWCDGLNDIGYPQWRVQYCWRIPQQWCGIISKLDTVLYRGGQIGE